MNRDVNKIIKDLIDDLPEIDKALDLLANKQAMSFAFLILTQRLYDPSIPKYKEIEDKSSFLFGAQEVLATLEQIPEALSASLPTDTAK